MFVVKDTVESKNGYKPCPNGACSTMGEGYWLLLTYKFAFLIIAVK